MTRFEPFSPHPGLFAKLPPSDAALVIAALIIMSVQVLFAVSVLNERVSTETAIRGGEMNEGGIGVPVFRNPLYAEKAVEHDIAALLHAGLFLRDTEGTLTPPCLLYTSDAADE